MKAPTRIDIYSRGLHDDEPVKVCTVDASFPGNIKIVLTRDEMGMVVLEASEVQPNLEFMSQIEDLQEVLTVLHESMTKTSIATQHAATELFAMGKWIPRNE